ncbi:MAG: CotH kinase family protein [Anaerolineales bacterium]|nr:CotH kinase family protein [Anaerolineales bacterium]
MMKQAFSGLLLPAFPNLEYTIQPRHANRHLWMGLIALLVIVFLLLFRVDQPLIENKIAFDPPEGVYEGDVVLKMRVSSPYVKIFFTLDGSEPTPDHGFIYSKPLLFESTPPSVTVVRARPLYQSGNLGPVVNATYFYGVETDLALMSLIIEPDDFWGEEKGIYANPTRRGLDWERPVDVLYLEASDDGSPNPVAFHVPAGLRIHGGTTRQNAPKKSLRLYWRSEYGLPRLDYPIFRDDGQEQDTLVPEQDGDEDSLKRLVVHNGGQDYTAPNWTLLRIRLMNDLADQIGVYSTNSKPVLLYINGESQGIYQLRERIDDWFFDESLDLESVDLIDAPFVPSTDRDALHWEHLVRYLETHDLVDPVNYEYVQSQIDVDNLIDYAILQMYAVNNDWLHHNVKQFRPSTQGGRWNWILWDVDYSFGKEWQSFYEFNMVDWLYTETQPNFERGSLLLRKLLENPDFRSRFLSRAGDLLNTTFQPDRVAFQVQVLAEEIRSDIHYEVDRWPRKGEWEESIEKMLEFVQRRPDAFRQNLVDGFELEGTDAILINPPTEGDGQVAVNGMILPKEPWRGIYFKGLEVKITAAPDPGFRFRGWQIVSSATGEPVEVPNAPQFILALNESVTLTPLFEPVEKHQPWPGDVTFGQVDMGEKGDGEGDWIELVVMRPGGVDLRNWRITDNDTKTATDEGSIFFTNDDVFRHIPCGIRIYIVPSEHSIDTGKTPQDDLLPFDGKLVLYLENGNLDASADPGFDLGSRDSLALLAPGPTPSYEDDLGIAFISLGDRQRAAVDAESFGILSDGVIDEMPFTAP